jgi:hypothetical protein
VTKRFAGATASSVKAAMAQKCKDKRNADAKRRKIAEDINLKALGTRVRRHLNC